MSSDKVQLVATSVTDYRVFPLGPGAGARHEFLLMTLCRSNAGAEQFPTIIEERGFLDSLLLLVIESFI